MTECGSHDALRSVFSDIWTARPNGANGMRLELCGMLSYAYADFLALHLSAAAGSLAYPFVGWACPTGVVGTFHPLYIGQT